MTIHVSSARQYRIRERREWATIVLSEWRAAQPAAYCGEMLIHSSFGSWAYVWHACGVPFRQFLLECDFDYLMSKLMHSRFRVFDAVASSRELSRAVLRARRMTDIDRTEARALWDALKDFSMHRALSAHEFVNQACAIAQDMSERGLPRASRLMREPWEAITQQPSPQAEGFWNTIWPVMCEQLRTECAQPVQG